MTHPGIYFIHKTLALIALRKAYICMLVTFLKKAYTCMLSQWREVKEYSLRSELWENSELPSSRLFESIRFN